MPIGIVAWCEVVMLSPPILLTRILLRKGCEQRGLGKACRSMRPGPASGCGKRDVRSARIEISTVTTTDDTERAAEAMAAVCAPRAMGAQSRVGVTGGSEAPFRVFPECFAASNWLLDPGASERSDQMRLRTIAAALMVAAPLLTLESPQAAACWWGTGYGYTDSTATTRVAPRRYGYTSYGYSSPAYYSGRRVGSYGYGVGVRRAGVGVVGAGVIARRR
jgi:hypothetical protein